MDTKQLIQLAVQKGENLFTMHLPSGAKWGETIDAIYEILQMVTKLAQEAAEKAKPVTDATANNNATQPNVVDKES